MIPSVPMRRTTWLSESEKKMLPAPSMAMPSGVWILAAIRLTVVAGVAVISSARYGVNLTAGDFADPGTGTHIYVPGGVYQDTFRVGYGGRCGRTGLSGERLRSEEDTSELHSPCNLVCRLL